MVVYIWKRTGIPLHSPGSYRNRNGQFLFTLFDLSMGERLLSTIQNILWLVCTRPAPLWIKRHDDIRSCPHVSRCSSLAHIKTARTELDFRGNSPPVPCRLRFNRVSLAVGSEGLLGYAGCYEYYGNHSRHWEVH